MKPFDLLNDPLEGINLIEAGAGTGKTFAIAGLYLRLIVEKGLGPDRILVVTYTNAATEELKQRIRRRLITAKSLFSGGSGDDPWLRALVDKIADQALALRRISDALVEFDRAAIFTIHGFCRRVLQQFAFETGHRFQSDLIQDQSLMIREIADDFWRRYVTTAPDELAAYCLKALGGPDGLLRLLDACRYPQIQLWPQPDKPVLSAIAPWRSMAGEIKSTWPRVRSEVVRLLYSPALNAVSYGKCAASNETAENTPRAKRIAELTDAMDLWPGTYPLSRRFALLSSARLVAATKKNHEIPRHPFFDLCERALSQQERMEIQLEGYVRYLKLTLLQRAAGQLEQKKARRNVISFDDLLCNVHRALAGRRGDLLVKAIRGQYAVALVDEFQDTDPMQCEIFLSFFGVDPVALFMIGDPKQAIYSFRGADVFAYLQAAARASRRYTLERNWRATPGLIAAVNAVFTSRSIPFGLPEIGFTPAQPARAEIPPVHTEPSLYLWCLESQPTHDNTSIGQPMAKSDAVDRIVEAVACRVVDLLSAPHPPPAEQIAVLTRSHRQAKKTKAALAARNVPAVLYSAGRVTDTQEAVELARVLRAVITPGNARYVRSALAAEMLGAAALDFETDESGAPAVWEKRWEHFHDYHQLWRSGGFYRMFATLMRREQVKATLLELPEGERRVTNLLHLAELLQQAETGQRLSMEGLLKWLTGRMHSESADADDQQLRLESDARAVQIITIHKSKGLQFDVVFCPFTWSDPGENAAMTTFHNPDDEHRLTLAIGPDIPPQYRQQGFREALAENLRLLYVALTRARQRCYWVWGRIRNTENSAPAYLLHGSGETAASSEHSGATTLPPTEDGFRRDLQNLVDRSRGSIVLEALPDHGSRMPTAAQADAVLNARRFTRILDNRWRIASFSSLSAAPVPVAASLMVENIEKDRDIAPVTVAPVQPAVSTPSIFDFPKGARAGLFFHDLLENWDFALDNTERRAKLITAKLKAYGFDNHWLAVVDGLLAGLATAELPDPWGAFEFRQVAPGQRINEMSFYFPLNRISADKLRQAFAFLKQRPYMDERGLQAALERLAFAPVEGILKGYVDLIFNFRGRYYLVDWKSNYLGDCLADYTPDRLGRVMIEEHYFLQYHLYVVALDQLLRRRMAEYAYERHFGGVFYVFLRGIGPGGSGIFHDLPDVQTIARLNRLLVPES